MQLKIKSLNRLRFERRAKFYIFALLLIIALSVLKFALNSIANVININVSDLIAVVNLVIALAIISTAIFTAFIVFKTLKEHDYFEHKSLSKVFELMSIKREVERLCINRGIYNVLKTLENVQIAEVPQLVVKDDFTLKISNLSGVTDKLSKFQSDLSSVLKDGLVVENYNLDKSQKFFTAKLINMSADNRYIFQTIDEYKAFLSDFKQYQIPFQKSYHYDMSKAPHMLISGVTGSGKSYMLYHVLHAALYYNCEIFVVDRKKDISKVKSVIGNEKVATEKDDVIRLIDDVLTIMNERETELENATSEEFSVDFRDMNYKPVYLIFDELSATVSEFDTKEQKLIMSKLKVIAQRGRSAGICLVVTMQMAKADTLDTAIRSQLNFKVVLGNSSRDTLHLLFSADDIELIDFEKGEGYFSDTARNGAKPSFLYVPTFLFDLSLESLKQMRIREDN